MENYGPSTYGDTIAEVYDNIYQYVNPDMIERLYECAPNGQVFELGIGTGRIAIPLLNRGINIDGIDSSAAMIEKLKTKLNGRHIGLQIGDFSKFKTVKKYDLIYIVFNTLYGLLTQEDQMNCFRCVSDALKPKGRFVIEGFVPDVTRFDRGQTIRTDEIETNLVQLECSKHDLINQRVDSQIIRITENGIKLIPVNVRYVWPSELNLMAKITGFELSERWSNWKKDNFNSDSLSHISIYEKAKNG